MLPHTHTHFPIISLSLSLSLSLSGLHAGSGSVLCESGAFELVSRLNLYFFLWFWGFILSHFGV